MARHPNLPLLDARVHHPGAERHTSAIDTSMNASPVIERVKQILPVERDVHAACGMFAGANPTTHTHNTDESELT